MAIRGLAQGSMHRATSFLYRTGGRFPGVLSVVGTVAYDTLARVKGLPEPEATAGVLDVHADLPGGTGGNVATALARLGLAPRVVSAVGPDFAGSPLERSLVTAGVDISGLEIKQTPTSRCYVFFDDEGRQVSYFFPGASSQFTGAAGTKGRAHFCAGEIARYPDLMRQADWVSFDPGQELFHRETSQILACMEHVDLLFINRHEKDILEKQAGWDLPRLFAAGLSAIVETRGGEGTLVHTPGGRFAAPAVPARVLDPTGAGDAHRAGFLFALSKGADMGVAARFASVMASFVIEHVGAQSGLPTLDAALARYEKAYGARPF